ncbi:hypothetical protein LINPERHAP1_LOCUS20894 [Linum perenne]
MKRPRNAGGEVAAGGRDGGEEGVEVVGVEVVKVDLEFQVLRIVVVVVLGLVGLFDDVDESLD